MPHKSKEGCSANKREYYKKNRIAIRATQTEYRKNNLPALQESESVRNAVRRDAGEYKSYYAENKDEILARCKAYRISNPARQLWSNARQRAKKFGLPFDISPDDIEVPEKCPVFGKTLALGNGKHYPWAPSLDRVIPSLGYIKGNIKVISHRANVLKGNASVEELELLANWMKRITLKVQL